MVSGLLFLAAAVAPAQDLRFDQSTNNNGVLFPNLTFPSANGHSNNIGGSTYKSLVESKGNVASIYYNNFNASNPFSTYLTPHDMAESIQTYVNSQWSAGQNGWIALNEISSTNWQNNPTNSAGYTYHNWVIATVALLKNGDNSDPSHVIPAHTNVIIWAPFSAPASTYRSDWQSLAQYAYIADEDYINGATVKSQGYSIPAVQAFYQSSFNAWVNNAGVPVNRLMLSEYYSNSTAGNGYGANGTSGEDWQAAIETRALAAYNVGFGGYIGYSWGNNAQGSSNAALVSYVNAYASTMVLPTEIPCWTGNDSSITGNSWADYLNWTGGRPSTTQFPYDPLLNNAANAGVIPQQTAANFLSHANPSSSGTTITLDGNQSVTTMTFNSPNPYTIAPGTGGSLTLSGANSSISVNQGSHSITAALQIANDVAVNLTGNLTIGGNLSTNGHTLTKSGNGALTISGAQTHAFGSAIAVSAGTVNLNSDAGSNVSRNLAVSATGGTINFGSSQHLASLSLVGTAASVKTARQYVLTNSLAIDNASTLDAGNNDLIVDSSDPSAVTTIGGYLASGYNHGNWNGARIVSSAAANDSTRLTTLAYAQASTILGSTGGTFDGQTVGPDAVLIKYTYSGDANLDGKVNADDYFIIDSNYNKSGSASGFASGDFNYDGQINGDDYMLIDSAFSGQGSPITPAAPLLAGASAVPEPGSLAICSMLSVAALMRRKRRRGVWLFATPQAERRCSIIARRLVAKARRRDYLIVTSRGRARLS